MVIIIAAMLLAGCSAEKNTAASRFYHSLISKYNIWFNGNEAYKAGVKKIISSHRDDYSELLPLFEYSVAGSARAASSDMERAAQKASKVISLYSITAKPEEKDRRRTASRDDRFYNRREYNEWVDDSWLLLGKAQFYQKNFMAARSSLSFAISITTESGLATEAAIWLARIQTEEGNYSEALRQLNEISLPGSSSLAAMYHSTRADVLLRQKRYGEAVEPLIEAIGNSSGNKVKVRLTYLLAQTCRAAGDNELSTRYFRQVRRMNPPYDLEFNASINLAGVADLSHGDVGELTRALNKMLRDPRNKDYLDQIYYALGELAHRTGNIDEALRLWSQSAASSTLNSRQKARAYLAMAQHYYSLPDYMRSWHYYDSASYLIDNTLADYDNISRRADALGEYAGYHTVVVTEDSLRRIASMSSADRDAFIAGLIRSHEEEQARERAGDGSDRYNMGLYYENEQRYRGAIAAEGGWYFYNQAALTFGRTEFRRRWGERRLEDNWRRANKTRSAFTPGTMYDATAESRESDSAGVAPERSKEYYLRNLPLTDSLMEASVRRSTGALLGEGQVLASRLNDTVAALHSLREAARSEGEAGVRAEALYELYRLQRHRDPAAAERDRAELLMRYPATEYALILSDPDYVNRHRDLSARAARRYDAAYQAFTEERYDEVIAICDEVTSQMPDDELTPRFMLLNALASGALEGEMIYKAKLDTLLARYPDTDEGKRAAGIIEFLRREKPEIRVAEESRIAEEIYNADTMQTHYVIIVLSGDAAYLNQAVFDVISYNLDHHPQESYNTEGESLLPGRLLIATGPFAGAAEAAAWMAQFNVAATIREAEKGAPAVMLISSDNLKTLREDKNPERYIIFHTKVYSGQ